jgi:DNA processing protein
MALGADSAAQEGALDAGGCTIAVLAAGAERAYPASKRALYRRLVAEAAVVSEMPPGFTAAPWAFPARNRIIAALAQLTVVVEAAERSGSLITTGIASELGREIAAVPGQVTAPLACGTNALLADGALVVRGAGDVLDALFGVGSHCSRMSHATGSSAPGRGETSLESHLVRLLEAVAAGHDTVETLTEWAGDLDSALAGLAELELRNHVRRVAGGRYIAVP